MRNCAGLVHSSTALIYMRIEPVSCWLGMLAMVTYRCMLPPKTGGREKENTKYNTFRAPCSTFYLFFVLFCFMFCVLCNPGCCDRAAACCCAAAAARVPRPSSRCCCCARVPPGTRCSEYETTGIHFPPFLFKSKGS